MERGRLAGRGRRWGAGRGRRGRKQCPPISITLPTSLRRQRTSLNRWDSDAGLKYEKPELYAIIATTRAGNLY